jgi:hypothetical protein
MLAPTRRADAAQAEHHDVGARLNLGGVDHCADARRHAAADVADLVERCVGANFRQRNLGQHGEVREGRAAHVVMDLRAFKRKARGAVGHHALALGRADGGAEVGLAREAAFAGAAFGRVERDHVVALLQRHDAWPDIDHDAGAFVAENDREEAFRIAAGAREFVGMADARCLDLDQHLAEFRPVEIDRLDLELLAGLVANGSLGLHAPSPTAVRSLEQGPGRR